MYFIGDVHGKTEQYARLVMGLPNDSKSIQVGDMGLGFKGTLLPVFDNHKFIRGNHDDPSKCRNHPNYLGEAGYFPETGIFYLGGAWSIDQKWREEGVSWWPDEELSEEQFDEATELYVQSKPRIVVTHDCPSSAANSILSFLSNGRPGDLIEQRTQKRLQCMLNLHEPEYWVFGHWHVSFTFKLTGINTTFICLNELEYKEIV